MGMFLGPPKQGSPPSPLRTRFPSRAAVSAIRKLGTVMGSPMGSSSRQMISRIRFKNRLGRMSSQVWRVWYRSVIRRTKLFSFSYFGPKWME